MPPITALLHTANDALRLGRVLETLLPCAEILIVDHRSTDATRRIAGEYGARVVDGVRDKSTNEYLSHARHDWILCLQPRESISESLQVSLFEWAALSRQKVTGGGFSFVVRQQVKGDEWRELPAPETRLIPRNSTRWQGNLPSDELSAIQLEGPLLLFAFP